jgi:hypothetical protein
LAGRKTVEQAPLEVEPVADAPQPLEIAVEADAAGPLAVEVTDETVLPEGAEVYEVDPTTPEGQLIEALLGDIDGYRAHVAALEAGNTALAFVFRGGMGRDDVVKIPDRQPGETCLVLTGAPQVDALGRWDLHSEPFSFAWEDPARRPIPLPRCSVTGDGCATASHDLGYCPHCPGCTREFLLEQGIVMPEEVEE